MMRFRPMDRTRGKKFYFQPSKQPNNASGRASYRRSLSLPEPHAGRSTRLLVHASPNDQSAAPSNTTSFNRNCPGSAESDGNPPRLGSHPGVENKNDSVVRNMITAPALPSADAFADQCRSPIKIAIATSTTPSKSENVCTLRNPYNQLIKGLFATMGSIPFASYPVNFIRPIQPITKTRP
jgi:hypothetical protein